MKKREHIIKNVCPGSIGEECGFEPGDILLTINGEEIEDIFDYRFMIQEEELVLEVKSKQGEIVEIEIEKDSDEELGLEFENQFMDDYHSCCNKCIFCFIDQMPPGMRETLYFKDDDARLSFLQGNYVTLTNMSDKDVERIIRYHLEPINISFQTMNRELRCKMLNNRFAGQALDKVDRFADAGITMNGQIVLCKNVNDGAELEYSISELTKYIPLLESVSVVPVGLSKYRDGLYPLEPFSKEDACAVLDLIHSWQDKCMKEHGIHFVHASDEWYLLAERELPTEDNYDGYLQLENGVGMLRLFHDEFVEALEEVKEKAASDEAFRKALEQAGPVSIATGRLPYHNLESLVGMVKEYLPSFKVSIYPIRNDFFGENITVSGLVTGQDLIAQLKGKELGSRLLLPENMLRCNEDVFLDDVRTGEVEKTLQVLVDIVKSSGRDFLFRMLDISPYFM
ncbi:MAG: DUF512 domain-containing protein [Lachnospiraceae bacterium]|nr:DUF512 domain-containing protein [Lachnospiraceae bacterium]